MTTPTSEAFKVEDAVEIPATLMYGRNRSPLRHAAENLKVGQCITIASGNKTEQMKISQQLSSLATTVAKDTDKKFITRSMFGEAPGDPGTPTRLSRLWRTR